MTQPVPMLFLAADPSETGWRLRFDEELREIQDAIHRGREAHALSITTGLAVRATDMQTLLGRELPRVVHFSGHGNRGRGITMDGEGKLLIPHLVSIFTHFRETVRLLVLNACTTLPVAKALEGVVDHVVATENPLDDEAAISFSRAFYGALALGETVPGAFEVAMNQLDIEGVDAGGTYRLLSRPGSVPTLPRPAPTATPTFPSPFAPPAGGQTIRIGSATCARTTFDNTTGDGSRPQDVSIETLHSTEVMEFKN